METLRTAKAPSVVTGSWTLPVLISLLAIGAALAFSLLVYPRIQVPLRMTLDPDRFGELAANISEGKGFVYSGAQGVFPAFDRGPVYPALLAVIFLIAGTKAFVAVQVFQSVLHGLTCLFVYLLALKLHPRRIALVSQVVCAIHPMLVWYTARIWIETTHAFLLALLALILVLVVERPSLSRSIAAGFVLGIASLTKSILLPFSLVAGAFILMQLGWRHAKNIVLMVAMSLAVVIPWTVRNYVESGFVVPVQTSLGFNLVQGDAIAAHWAHMPFSTLDLWAKGKSATDSILSFSGASPVEPPGDRILIAASLEYSFSHPLIAVKRALINGLTFWYLSESPLKSTILALLEFPLLVLTLLGSFRLWKRSKPARMLMLLAGYYFVAHALVVGWARYSVPIIPVCVALAVGVFYHLQERNGLEGFREHLLGPSARGEKSLS